MPKNIKGTSSLAGKNVKNSESIGDLTADTIRTTTLVATNATITNLTNTELQTATTNITALQTSKQDVITETTNIQLAELEVNDKIKFQFGTTDDEKTLIQRGDANGKLKFTANNVFFHDDTDTEVFAIKNNGDLNCFDNTIDNVSDIDLNGSSLVTQLSAKQDTITAGDGLSFTGATLNAEVTQAELDAKQDTITAGDGLSFTGATLNAEVTQFELDQKQDVLTAGNGINITAGLGTTISVDEAELTTKQDLITDSTDIGLNELEVNDTIYFQRSGSSDTKTNIKRSTTGGKMRLNADGYVFKDETNGNNLLVISDSGTCTTTSVQADFFSSITDTELDTLDNITGNVQTQIDAKQDTITSSTALSVASINLNSGNLTNGATGNFSAINLNGSDLQDKIDDKADVFGILLPLELDGTAFPNPALKLNYNATEFQLNGSDELALTGSLPTLTSSLNCGTNSVTGITSLSVRSIELHNSTSGQSFLDFGGGDYRLRQIFNQTANTFTFLIDDATGENPEEKLQITRTEVNILNAELDLNDNNIINVGAVATSNYPTTAILRMASFNTPNTNSTSSGLYGNDSYLNSFSTAEIELGTSFISNSSGIFTIGEAGTFKITCTINGDNASVNDRVVLGFYISKNDDSSAWQSKADQFGMMYLRDDNFGQGGSCSFTSIRTLALSDTIRIKTKFGQGGNTWQETRDDGDVDVWANITFEKLF